MGTKLIRVQNKIFASNALSNEIGQFGSAVEGVKLETGDVATIQALNSWVAGWSEALVSGNRYPTLQEMNGLTKVLSYQLSNIFQDGIATFEIGTEYFIGSVVKKDGTFDVYGSLTDNNVGNLLTDTTNWKYLGNLESLNATSLTKFSVNSGNVDSNGDADILDYTGATLKTKSGGSYADIVYTNIDNATTTLSSELTLDVSSYSDGVYNVLVNSAGSTLSTYSKARPRKDLLVDFSQGNANDNYGFYSVEEIGSPTYTGNKFNSNGTTGVRYNGVLDAGALGTGKWCMQGLFKSTNTTTTQQLFSAAVKSVVLGANVEKDNNNKLRLFLSSNGISNDIINGLEGTKSDWGIITDYYIRIRFTGMQYLVDWSLDGITWTNDITVANTTSVYGWLDGLWFGCTAQNLQPLIGTMDNLMLNIGQDTCEIKNRIVTDKVHTYKQTNDIFVNTGIEPMTAQLWDGSAYADFTGTPLGDVTVSSNTVSVIGSNEFNKKLKKDGTGYQRVDAIVYDGVTTVTWRDLDLSNIIGETSCLVLLRLHNRGSVTDFAFRQDFDNSIIGYDVDNWYGAGTSGATVYPTNIAYVLVPSLFGAVGWKVTTAGSAQITLVGYIKQENI